MVRSVRITFDAVLLRQEVLHFSFPSQNAVFDHGCKCRNCLNSQSPNLTAVFEAAPAVERQRVFKGCSVGQRRAIAAARRVNSLRRDIAGSSL